MDGTFINSEKRRLLWQSYGDVDLVICLVAFLAAPLTDRIYYL